MEQGAFESDVIRARKIELVDEAGNTSIVLEGERAGVAALTVYNGAWGTRAVTLGVPREGTPFVMLGNREAGSEVLINFTRDGEAAIYLKGADGRQRKITPLQR